MLGLLPLQLLDLESCFGSDLALVALRENSAVSELQRFSGCRFGAIVGYLSGDAKAVLSVVDTGSDCNIFSCVKRTLYCR